jgi:hypothetical protein
MVLVKGCLAWGLAVVALVGVCVSYFGIWVLIAYFAAGLVWWGQAALLCSGPIGGIGALLAWVKAASTNSDDTWLDCFGGVGSVMGLDVHNVGFPTSS